MSTKNTEGRLLSLTWRPCLGLMVKPIVQESKALALHSSGVQSVSLAIAKRGT